jgi:hypothetical protein
MTMKNSNVKRGQCVNYGNCPKANSKEIIEINIGDDFKCPNPNCGCDLVEVPIKPLSPWIIYAIVAVLILGGGAAYWFFQRDKAPQSIEVAGISLNITSQEMPIGATLELIATVLPEDAADKTITWASSNEAVATVADRVVAAVAEGSASITVTTVDGAKTATCAVTVIKPQEPAEVRDTVVVNKTDTVKEVIEVPVSNANGKRYPFGRYVGDMRDGRPHGEGRMYYTRQVRIATHDINNTYCAEVGDVFYGSWWNGDIEQGDLKDSHNNPKATLRPGRRPNPYDITNDGPCQ